MHSTYRVKIAEIESLNDASATTVVSAQDTSVTAQGTVFREGLEILPAPLRTPHAQVTNDAAALALESQGVLWGRAEAVWAYTDTTFFGGLGLSAVTRRRALPGNTTTEAKAKKTGGDSQEEQRSSGEIVYVGLGLDPESLVGLAADTLSAQGVHVAGGGAGSPWVEQRLRRDRAGILWRISINHGDLEAPAADGSVLAPFEVKISRELI